MRTLFLSILFLLLLSCNRQSGNAASSDCIDPDKIREDAACPMIYKPVCGCNGKTYSNACEASVAGLRSWTEGPCTEEEIK